MTHRGAAWRLLFEQAALRRDARVFALIVQSVPQLARASIQGTADYRYVLPYFDDVVFKQIPDRVQYLRLGRLHRDQGPAEQLQKGVEAWYRHGVLHNTSGPAILMPEGFVWVLYGKRHRENGPAEFYKKGEYERQEWFQNGKRHRIGGPAVKDCNEEEWYVDGLLHRDDGPAVVTRSAGHIKEEWYNGGVRHRVDGPAVIDSVGLSHWYLYGFLHNQNSLAVEVGTQRYNCLYGKIFHDNGVSAETKMLLQFR